MRPMESTLGGRAPTMPRNRAGMRRSGSRPLRLPRRVAKSVKAPAKAAAVGMRGRSPGVGQGGESLAESKDLLDIGTEPCHHGEGPSDRGRPLRVKIACFCSKKGLKIMFRDVIDPLVDLAAGLDRGADGLVEGRRDVDANPLVARAGMEVESGMLLAGPTPAVGLAAGAVLKDQRAAKQGLVGEELDGAGSRVALLG